MEAIQRTERDRKNLPLSPREKHEEVNCSGDGRVSPGHGVGNLLVEVGWNLDFWSWVIRSCASEKQMDFAPYGNS